MAHVKHVIQYLMLVGLPFLGLLGVLHVGRDLAAPMAVHGRYAVLTLGGGGPCLRQLLADSALVVTQSGDRIEIRLGSHGPLLHGHLTGDRLTAQGELPATAACPGGDPIRFEGVAARLDRRVRVDALLRAECPACGSLTVEASRPRRTPAPT